MKKTILIVFFLILPIAFAEVSVKQDLNNYNLGDKISVSASAIEDDDLDGFFKATLECTNYLMQYFVTPISLEKNFRTVIDVPALTVIKDMLGTCKIKAAINSLKGVNESTDEKYTDEFKVKNELNVNCESAEAIPNKEFEISCIARKISLELVKNGVAKLTYMNNEYMANIEEGIFSFIIFIQGNTRSGMKKTTVDIEDGKGNYGNLIFEFNVKAIPTKLEIEINKEIFKPEEKLEITPALYDHVNDLINTTISLELIDPNDRELISEGVSSSESINYVFDTFALPGNYKIIGYSEGLTQEVIVAVESVSKLEMTYNNEIVLVKNTGNILYDGKTTIVLEDEKGEKFLIEKKLKLEPGQEEEIELSKEVPHGNYNVILPEEHSKKNETETANVIENVEIRDNRPIYKKAARGVEKGFDAVTGAAVGTVGFVSARPLFASIILIVIILVIVLFYSRDFIRSKISGVKVRKNVRLVGIKDDKDLGKLFKDFKYKEE